MQPLCISYQTSVRTGINDVAGLSCTALQNLFLGHCSALRIKNFLSARVIDHAVREMKKLDVTEYTNAAGVGEVKGLGMAYFEAKDSHTRSEYFRLARPTITRIREIFNPYLASTDHFRLILEEEWPHGASLLRTDGKAHFVGLARAISQKVLPHQDDLLRDDGDSCARTHYIGQFAFNVYLANKKGEGALQLWPYELTRQEYDRLRGDSYGINPTLLPPPSLTIIPRPGDLIIFNARNLHSVEPVSDLRITTSGFILYQGENLPLHLLWS